MLKEKLLEDLKDAMKTKNVNKKNAVQMVRTAILQIEKDKGIEVSDEQILGIVAKEVKTRKDAIAEYSKRLSKYCKLEVIEVADEKTPDQASENVEQQIRKKEGERILRYVKEDAYVITLEIGGTMLDSVAFAKKIETLGVQGKSHIIFIIGGSIGLGEDVLKRSDYGLSFSKMTFPHQLMRVILLEQVYRSYRIIEGAPYHK